MVDFLTRTKRFGGSVGIIVPSNYVDIIDLKDGEIVKVTIEKSGGENDEAAIKH